MAVCSRLVSLFSLASIAVLICSLQAVPVAALSVDHAVRGLHHPGHDALAKRKRSTNSKRCKPRPAPSSTTPASSSDAPASSSAPAPAPAAPSPSPSSTAQQSSAAPAPSPTGKFGVGWPNGDQDLEKWSSMINTMYTWSPQCPDSAQSLGIRCCPMLWGWRDVNAWTSLVMNTNPPCVMGPNEPEITTQSNMSPASGVELWNTYIRPMKSKGAELISPAPTSDPAGKRWLQDFFSICGGDCGVDRVAVHWYDVEGSALEGYLTDMHSTFGLKLWVSEFACQNFNGGPQCTMDAVWQFQSQVTAFMQQADFVEFYMPFGALHNMDGVNFDNQLMNPDGTPNQLAHAYAGR